MKLKLTIHSHNLTDYNIVYRLPNPFFLSNNVVKLKKINLNSLLWFHQVSSLQTCFSVNKKLNFYCYC